MSTSKKINGGKYITPGYEPRLGQRIARWGRHGLIWSTLATHPESVYSGRNADR